MKTYYKNNLKQAYLILEEEGDIQEDYQVCMLQENHIPGLLPFELRYVDNIRHYYYDISGKVSLKAMHERVKLSREEMEQLVQAFLATTKHLRRYMLDADGLLLDPAYIFCEKEHFFFCYVPQSTQILSEEFHRLTEYFVEQVDYQDKEGVRLAYTLHKSTMEKHYSIERIMEEIMWTSEEEKPLRTYAEQMQEVSMQQMMVLEKKDFWEPVRRFLERRKRDRQQEWEKEQDA